MSQSDVAALRDAYEAFGRGEFDVASRILAPAVDWVEHGKSMPYSGTWHGPESVVNDVWTVFAQYWGGSGVVGLEAEQFLDAGDQIVVTGRFTGRDSEGESSARHALMSGACPPAPLHISPATPTGPCSPLFQWPIRRSGSARTTVSNSLRWSRISPMIGLESSSQTVGTSGCSKQFSSST